jgi:hypothetical protein
MSGFTEHQASDASEASGRRDVVLTWATAQSMLPLVRRIVADVVETTGLLLRLEPEKDRLDRRRHQLDWPERSRRYQLGEEIRTTGARLVEARTELEALGVVVIDALEGQIGFPTIVNNRRAFFSWRTSEEEIGTWHYADSRQRRVIPHAWKEQDEKRAARRNS